MRTLLFLLSMVFASTMSKADDKVLQIWQSDGQVMTIKLSEEPKTSYADGETLTFTNLRPSTTIQLYNVAGQLTKHCQKR